MATYKYLDSTGLGQVWEKIKNYISNNFLSKTNTTAYTPTTDYHPATKKYVDDVASEIPQSEWVMFPHRTNPAVDSHNSYSINNGMELGTASTLRHNLMLESISNTSGVFIATWTEGTGSKDYADSSGQTSVYAQLWQDKWNTRRTDITATIETSAVVDVFPIGDTVYDENGNALCTIVAASDSTVKTRSNGQIFIGIIYGSDGKSHIVYRTATISSFSISLDNNINVLLINGAEWNMTTLREDYSQATSQLNTYIIYRSNYYFMAVVQNGVGVAVMKSSDCIDWSLQAHIPDTDAHLEACICVTAWVNNNLPTVFVAVRHPYGDGYLSLHCFNNLNFEREITKAYIPASSGRPMMVSDSNAKRAFLCFSTNGRRNAVIVRIGSNNDGTTAYELMTTPLDIMSNYPCIAMNNKLLLFGGTNGLSSSKLGVSVAPLWTEELTNYDNYEENLLSTVINGIPTASSTTPSADGTGAVGTSTTYARADHVHPKITQALSISSNVITLTGSDGTTSSVTLPVYNGGVSS